MKKIIAFKFLIPFNDSITASCYELINFPLIVTILLKWQWQQQLGFQFFSHRLPGLHGLPGFHGRFMAVLVHVGGTKEFCFYAFVPWSPWSPRLKNWKDDRCCHFIANIICRDSRLIIFDGALCKALVWTFTVIWVQILEIR